MLSSWVSPLRCFSVYLCQLNKFVREIRFILYNHTPRGFLGQMVVRNLLYSMTDSFRGCDVPGLIEKWGFLFHKRLNFDLAVHNQAALGSAEGEVNMGRSSWALKIFCPLLQQFRWSHIMPHFPNCFLFLSDFTKLMGSTFWLLKGWNFLGFPVQSRVGLDDSFVSFSLSTQHI